MSMTHTERGRDQRPNDEEMEEEDYAMPHRYEAAGQDREISLGTGTILAMFLALALVCSVFFGMGYKIGRKSSVPEAVVASSGTSERSLSDAFKSFKPAPGSPGKVDVAAKEADAVEPSTEAVTAPSERAKVVVAAAAAKKPFDPDAEIVTSVDPVPTPKTAVTPHVVPIAQGSPVAVAGTGSAMVQVAAVSHQEDADAMLAALKRKGYSVAVHHEPQDKLLHLQLGPYPSKKDADAMRLRLQADGYNAILK